MINIFHHTHAFVKKHKKYHHYFLLSLVSLSLGFFLYNKAIHVHAATYNFVQTDWSSYASTTATANHTNDKTGWKYFYATSSTSVIASASGISLALTSNPVTDTTFASGTASSTTLTGSGDGTSVSIGQQISVSNGDGSSCAVSASGSVYCWGYNASGQLGDNTLVNKSVPVQVLGVGGSGTLSGIKQVASAANNRCAVSVSGSVYCWGYNGSGGLGDNTLVNKSVPVQVLGVGGSGTLSGITQIAAGASIYSNSFVCALSSSGSVYCWGYNGSGQLGDNTLVNKMVPVQVLGVGGSGTLSGITQLATVSSSGPASGNSHVCAVSSSGSVYCWGYNAQGQLGDNTLVNKSVPVQVLGVGGSGTLSGISKISTGLYHTCAVSSSGSVYCWGYNAQGQLGDNTLVNKSVPVQVLGVGGVGTLSGITQIVAEGGGRGSSGTITGQSCAVSSSGSVYCWGYNGTYGTLGDNTLVNKSVPVQVLGVGGVGTLSGIKDVAVYGGGSTNGIPYPIHACAVSVSGSVYCWGYNGSGGLGDNTLVNKMVPVQVLGVGGVGTLSLDTYFLSGVFTSAIFDTGAASTFTDISVASTSPSGTLVSIKVRSSNSSSMAGAPAFSTCSIIPNGSTLAVGGCVTNGHRYLQYQATLTTNDTTVSPSLDSVTLNYSQFAISGDLTSSKYDTTSDGNLISNITWTVLDNNGNPIDGVNEIAKFQLKSASTSALLDSASWCGPTICGAGADYFTVKTGSSVLLASTTHPLKTGGNDRWFQYKAFLISGGALTPVISNVSIQYVVNAPPAFDPAYGTNGISVYENATSTDANWGKTVISYAIKDEDGDSGSVTTNYVKPTFEYSLNNGSTWTTISTSTLTYTAPSGGALGTYQGNTTNLIATSTYKTYTVLWDAKSQIATSSAVAKIRVTLNDNEAANNTVNAVSSTFNLDSVAPTGSINFDAGVAGQVGGAIINIKPIDATTSVQYLISDDPVTNSSASSTGWVSVTANATTTISWTFDSDVEAKTLKFQFRDAYGNTTATTTLTTVEPIPPTSFLVQDTSSILAPIPVYSMYIGWQSSTSTIFADYELEYATSSDNTSYGPYFEVAEITDVNSIYYVHTNLNPNLYYRYRFGIRDTNDNTSVRPTIYTAAHPDGVQNYGEGGGGTSMTAPVMKNIYPTQGSDGSVTVTYTLTDVNKASKTTPSYEAYLFYDNGVTVSTASTTGITLSDASKMPASGFIQIKDEVIRYTSKTGNTLNGLTRGTWPTTGTTRTTNANSTFFANTPIWIMATSTTPVLISPDTDVLTGHAGSISWDTSKEISLVGSSYSNVGMRVLVHDNQAAGSGPVTTQNISSDDGKLVTLDMLAPTIEFVSTSATVEQDVATTSDKFKVKLSKAYPYDVTFSYSLSGTAENNGVDYTMATTTVTISAGATTTNIYANITPAGAGNSSASDKTIIITLNSPTNATLGTNISSVYTIHNSYISPSEFAVPAVISQITSGNDLGKILIAYSIRNVNAGDSANGISNIATSTFKYSLDSGTTWTTITNLSAGSLDGKTVDAVTYTATPTTFASTTDSTSALWDVASQLATSSSNLMIKVTTTAGTIKPTSAATTSNTITFDAKKPVVTLNLNLLTNTIALNITDNNNISYIISNNSDLSADGVNASSGIWQNTASTSVASNISWTFTSETNPTIYYSVKDALGNTITTTSNSAPATITGVQLKDVSNLLTSTFGEVLTWDNFSATTTSAFGKYQIYRATSTEDTYSLLSEITNALTISFRDNTVATSTLYYYKLLTVDSDGDTSAYSSSVNDTPDGSNVVNTPPVITEATSTNVTANGVTITWTTNEYATSTVKYSTSQGIFSTSADDSTLVKSHSMTLSNLIPGTNYYFEVLSTNVSDITATDNNGGSGYIFRTKGGPRITNVRTTQGTITDTTASIFWDTDILSDSDVYYSTESSTVNSATSSVHLSDTTATTTHQIDITGLSPATTYYFKVMSASAADPTLTSTDDNKSSTYPYAVQYHNFTTLDDNAAPTISNAQASYIAANFAVITWTTNELATSQVNWGTSSTTLATSTTLDSLKVLNHNVTVNGLNPTTTYYFNVSSTDATNHNAVSTTTSFTTTRTGEDVYVSAGGGGSSQVVDTVPPIITSYAIDQKSLGAFNVDVKIQASENVRAFVTYGETTEYGSTEGDNVLSTSKTISLKKLKTGTTYHYRVQVIDKAGNDVSSADGTFKTKFISELLDDRTILDKADDLQGQIEALLESALPSLSPPFVSVPIISNITESGATISWKTNIKTIGTLSYATDEEYVAKKDYVLDVSAEIEKSATHVVELANLKPNTKYHIQAKSYVFPQVMGKSEDLTFNTKAAKVKADILEKRKDGFTIAWSTEDPTTSIVEYKNQKTGETNRITDATMKTYHAVKIENLPSATSYSVKVSGVNTNGNTIEAADTIDVTTSSDTIAPTISNFKVDNALIPGRTDRIQTVVGWMTDEPANAVVYYEEGAGVPGDTKELASKVESLDVYTPNHIMILASLKPGAIYRIKVISSDESGNSKVFGPRTIITPRQTESVLDIIFKNFEDTFKFLRQ